MAEFEYADIIVNDKKLSEWLKSDEGLVDYSKCKFKRNVSNSPDIVIFDLDEYEFDTNVGKTIYHNGVDLARVAACVEYGSPYKGMSFSTALNGDDYVRIFFNNFVGATVQDFILYFFKLLDGDIYISETNYHVFVKGRPATTDEEWKAAAETLSDKYRHKN